jgi:hypothetical protein
MMVNLNQPASDLSHENKVRDSRVVYTPKVQTQKTSFRVDDVISALSNAHENRRARQVVEWEKLARQHFQLNA